MPYTPSKPSRRGGVAWRSLAIALSAVAMAPAAHATDIIETVDFSNSSATPTQVLTPLTPGSNYIVGAINSYGDAVGPHGELTHQDMDYITFTIPVGYALTNFIVSNGTTIATTPRADSIFLGLYRNPYTPVDPSFTSATGLLGWTLVTQSDLGTDILPSISNPLNDPALANFPVPGATTFTPPLGAGTYTLWLYDGDAAATYSFNAVVAAAAVPEAGTWLMTIAGFGMMGAALRARPRPRTATA